MALTVASIAAIVLALLLLVKYAVNQLNRRSLKDLRGPPCPSILLGNEMEMTRQDQVGDLEFQWIREYGLTWRTAGCLGKEYLMTADPKAIQYIYQTSGYNYPKSVEATQTIRILADRGISWANGDVHQRQRKVMNPAFSSSQLRSYLPIVQRCSSKLSQKWKDQISMGAPSMEQVINVAYWLSRAALDISGETSFDYRFDALDNSQGELLQCVNNVFADSMLFPPAWDFLFRFIWPYVPERVLYFSRYLPTREYRRFRNFVDTAKRIGREIVTENMTSAEKGRKDVMSMLILSNNAEDPKRRLDEDEVLSQITNVLIASYDTTASSLGWLFLELSLHPEDQCKIRDEVLAIRSRVAARGGSEFTIADYDSMTFMNHAIKEALRLHPIVPTLNRVSLRDDVIPLSAPIETKSGKIVTQIPINKGQEINISVCGYNRLKSVWGEDADVWNPMRWADTSGQHRQTSVGAYSNLMSFGAGVKSCIGWRLALLEMQCLLSELLEAFEFTLPSDVEIQRVPMKMMIPMVRGRMHEGVQLPLKVSLVERA